MDEGYLQTKLREQGEEILELKNKIRELEIKTRQDDDEIDVSIGKRFISIDKRLNEIDKENIDKKIDEKIKTIGGLIKYLFDKLNSQSKEELNNIVKAFTQEINKTNSGIEAVLSILVNKNLTTELDFNSLVNDAYNDNKKEKFLRYRERCNSTSFTDILKKGIKTTEEEKEVKRNE